MLPPGEQLAPRVMDSAANPHADPAGCHRRGDFQQLDFRVETAREHLPARVQAHEMDGRLGEVEANRGDLSQYAPAGWLSGR